MQRPLRLKWILTAIMGGALQLALAAPAMAQPTLTRELDSPSRGDRYAETVTVTFLSNFHQAVRSIVPAIPDGKKLLLQSVSIRMALTNGQSPTLAELNFFEGLGRDWQATLFVDMDLQASDLDGPPPSRQRHFTGNRDLNIVMNAGESITVVFSRNGSQGVPRQNSGQVTLVGYFVDVDPQTPPTP